MRLQAQQCRDNGATDRHVGRRPQSRAHSMLEAVVNVVFGFLLALVMQGIVYPLLGIVTTGATNLLIAAIVTLVSLVRSYLVRRAFETFQAGSGHRHART